MQSKKFDYIIIGGGIFGVYSALFLAKKNKKILLIERGDELMKKASIINQARLHCGYHYPRSILTAQSSNDNKLRFIKDHEPFINSSFKQYYAIDKYGSFTDVESFERFCDFIKIKYTREEIPSIFKSDRIARLYLTEEFSFDPVMIAEFYKEKIKNEKNIEIMFNCEITSAEKNLSNWLVHAIDKKNNLTLSFDAPVVINATYSNLNTINQQFNLPFFELSHEITEMVFLSSDVLKNVGLTVMDGHYCSIMPYGNSQMLSLSSVTYTPIETSQKHFPTFSCQKNSLGCTPDFTHNCNFCNAKPKSNWKKMVNQMHNYVSDDVQIDYLFSMITIKSKLKASYIDDSRPTIVKKITSNPDYYCLFAGKINCIYELEEHLDE